MRRAALIIAPWLALLTGWEGIHYSGLINPALVPPPHDVAVRFVERMGRRRPLDIIMSTRRVFVGGLCSIALVVPTGFILGWYRDIRIFIDPLINFFRARPPIALIPLGLRGADLILNASTPHRQ